MNLNYKTGGLVYKIAMPLTIVLCVSIAVAQETISVNHAIELALSRNLQVKQASLSKDNAEQDLYQAKSNFYPNLNVTVNQKSQHGLVFDQVAGALITGDEWTFGSGAGIYSSVALFQGFRKLNQVKVGKIGLEMSIQEIERIKNDLTLQVLITYLEALTNQELWIASKDQLALSIQQLNMDSIQFEVGNKTLADISQSKSQVASNRLNCTNLENSYMVSLLSLKQLLEIQPETMIRLQSLDLEKLLTNLSAELIDADYLYQLSLETQPEVKIAALNTKLYKQQIEIAKGGYYPSVMLNLGYGTNYSSVGKYYGTTQKMPFNEQLEQNKSFSAGVTLTIPVFANNQTKIGVSKSKINLDRAINNENIVRNSLNKTVHQARLDASLAGQRLSASLAAYESADVAFITVKERYEIGAANILELSTAQTNRNQSEFNLIQAKYALLFRIKIIDYYLGNPIIF